MVAVASRLWRTLPVSRYMSSLANQAGRAPPPFSVHVDVRAYGRRAFTACYAAWPRSISALLQCRPDRPRFLLSKSANRSRT